MNAASCGLHGVHLIEASAGTGKTWTLCGLYLRLLLERELSVSQILVVTFTNAATAELRERIRTRLLRALEWLEYAPPDTDPFIVNCLSTLIEHGRSATSLRDALQGALQCFDEAAIFTIHGFCQRALSEASFSAGMPLSQELLRDDAALRAE
ncbi:MAG: UvrD-helicase domain-containing protein, partial [Burkholderiales bacterium]|nr:UvrD-helicase domain-containing protein [Burkholderiales bacterium]